MLVFGYNHVYRSIVLLTTVADEESAFQYIAEHEKKQEEDYTLYLMYYPNLCGDEYTFHRACVNKYAWKCEGISALKHCRMMDGVYVFYHRQKPIVE